MLIVNFIKFLVNNKRGIIMSEQITNTKAMKSESIRNLCLGGLFAAITAVFAQIQFSVGPVPISLATFAVLLAGSILRWKYGAISQIVYVLLGIVGAPVFALFSGVLGIVMGKTGGYILGYIVCAFLVGIILEKSKKTNKFMIPIAMVIGTVVLYAFGTAWFMFITNTGLWQSLVWCVFPFLIGDAVKIIAATMLTLKLKKVL